MNALLDRFLRYVKIDTQSDEDSETCPSTEKQWNLARLLVDEMQDMGLVGVSIDEKGYVMAHIPSNTSRTDVPAIGFIAHYDTTPQFSGTNVNPLIHENYGGGDILLQANTELTLSPSVFPILSQYRGKTLITTDGNSLLGADDKAGIAEILTAADYLLKHPEVKHGKICIGFTPDEEIGRGADFFDVEKFGADFAYTMDGGEEGELEFENFNAAGAQIKICGRSVHPGSAKNNLINATQVGMELHSMLPVDQRPEYTEAYDGFYMLYEMQGGIDTCTMTYIIRDHDRELFEHKKRVLLDIVDYLNKKYGPSTVNLTLKDQYYNMREKIAPVMYIIEEAAEAMREIGVKPIIKPIRGGTDGARLSFMGLPCPNLFTGGHNFHGRYEFAVVESMQKSVELIVKIAERFAK